MPQERHAVWGVCKHGYCVQTFQGDECVDEYRAGNDPHDSQGYVDPEAGLPISILRKYAEQTATEMAGDSTRVQHDPGLDAELREHFGESKP